MSDETERQSTTFSGHQQLELLSEEFRSRWLDGGRPSIEEYLERVPEAARSMLLRELIAAELEVRKAHGESVKLWEYYQRFPKQPNCVDAALRLLSRRKQNGLIQTIDHEDSSVASKSNSSGADLAILMSEGPQSWDTATRRIAQFQLLEHLGEGRFGSVWKARDTKLDRTVAIKIPRNSGNSQRQTDLFFREARSAAQMRHPNAVSIYEVGRDGETLYMATEFIQGVNLRQYLDAHGPRAPKKAAEFCASVAEALHCAHEAGVIHRDLKPSNIMVDVQGQPHVADFGLAKRKEVDLTLTVEGQVIGTPAYMSPEQADGQARSADRRTDVYSLGVILFELITGELPFRGDRQMLIVQKLRDQAPSPRQLNSRIPRDLETICLRCLERDPAKRYSACGEICEDLRRFIRGEAIKARPLGTLERTWRALRNPHTAMATAGGYTTFLSMILLLWAALGPLGAMSGRLRGNLDWDLGAPSILIGTLAALLFYCGVSTLGGRRHALAIGSFILSAGFLLTACFAAGFLVSSGDHLLISSNSPDPLIRFQIFGLVSLLFACGIPAHLIAMANLVGDHYS